MADNGGFRVGSGFIELTARDNTYEGRMRAQRAVQNLRNGTVTIDANIRSAEARIAQVRARLTSLSQQASSPQVDLDTAQAQAQLAQLEARLQSLRDARVNVDVDSAVAIARLRAIESAAGRVRSAVGSAGQSGQALGSGVANGSRMAQIALMALPGAASIAAAAIAAIPGALSAVGASVGVLFGAFSGVGDALKGYTADQKAATAGGGAAASAAQSNARAIRDATQQVDEAKRQQARTFRETAAAIADAERGVADAVTQASRTARDGARSVEQAQRAVADAQRDAARTAEDGAASIASASRRVIDAARAEQRAQEDLTAAREDAARQLQDYAEKVHDLAIDQVGAQIALDRAQEKLLRVNDDATASDLDKRDAAQDVVVAQERVRDLTRESTEAQAANTKAQADGIDGAKQVVDAQDRVTTAAQASADAQTALAKAQTDAAVSNEQAQQRVADAQVAASDAQVRAAEANSDAQQRVEDAQRSLSKAQQDAADQQEDAARRVADALQGLSDAQKDAATSAGGGAGAASAYAEAMKKLTPEARAFVEQLIAMKPLVKGLSDSAAKAFLPGLTLMLKDSVGLFPILNAAMAATGTVMAGTAIKMGDLFKSATFKENLQILLQSTLPVTRAIGDLFVAATEGFVSFGAKMAPVTQAFAGFIDSLSSGLGGFFDELVPSVGSFVSIWDSLGQTMDALLPILGKLLAAFSDAFAPVLQYVAGFLQENEEAIKAWLPLVAGVATAFASWKILSAILSPIGGLIAGVGTRIAQLAGVMGASTAATSRIGAVFSRLGSSLPLIGVAAIGLGLAFDKLSEPANKAIDAMLKGGDAAAQAMPAYKAYADSMRNTNPIMQLFVDSSAQVEQAYRDQVAAMSPLEQAQLRARQAQTAYGDAVRNFGLDSQQARGALQSWNAATAEADLKQRAAAAGTDEHTQALADLTGQIQSALGSDIAYQQSLITVKDAQKAAADAARDHGAGSDQAQAANLRLVDAVNSSAEAASRKAEADAKAAGVSDTAKIKADAYMMSLLSQAAAMDGPAQAALLKYAGNMTEAQRKAISADAATSGFKTQVLTLPDGRTVTIIADTANATYKVQQFRDLASRPINVAVNAVAGNAVNMGNQIIGMYRAKGAFTVPMAQGGMLHMARGGNLTPMSGSKATMVPADSWRVIGDNMRYPELFAPMDGSARSLGFIEQAAATYGMGLAPLGSGGTSAVSGTVQSSVSGVRARVDQAVSGATSVSFGDVVIQGILDFRRGQAGVDELIAQIRERLREAERARQ